MGVGENLKEFYYSWEEKWYNTLDRIDEHLPIYKVVDKIDEVFPSFALFLILIFIILLSLLLGVFGFIGGSQATLSLSVVDEEGNMVSGASVELAGIDEVFYTNDFGLITDLSVPFGATISVKAQKDNVSKTVPVRIDDYNKVEEIKLSGLTLKFAESKVLQILTETGTRVTDRVTVNFECSAGVTPPTSRDVFEGTTNVESPANCGTLTATIISEKYKTARTAMVQPTTTIVLESSVPTETGRVVITLKNTDGNTVTEAIRVQAYYINNLIAPAETVVAENGQAIFNLPQGDYKFKTLTDHGYKAKESNLTTISTTGTAQVTLTLEKSYVGRINVEVKTTTAKIEDAKVTIMKGTSEVNSKQSDSNGTTHFDLAEEGNYTIYATKQNYCEAVANATVPANVILTMKRNTGDCGGKLVAKVVDGDGKPVPFARVLIFKETEGDAEKAAYEEGLTDYNGEFYWNPVKYTVAGQTYKVFAFKGTYSGWSTGREFIATNEAEPFRVRLEIPMGRVIVTVKDSDSSPLQFGEVQLFGDYDNARLTGKKIVEGTDGRIEFNLKAGRRVYAVVKKEGYESYTTLPKMMIGDGTISYEVTLTKPPVEEIAINFLGLFKNDAKALRVEPGQEYMAIFEITAPKDYEELGFFVRAGKDNVTKTELDKLYIKDIIAPGVNTIQTGTSYNPPKGNTIDDLYLNLEQSKWGKAVWRENNFVQGKIRVGALVKIKENAQQNEQLIIAYRAWGVLDGVYERDLIDSVLGTSRSSNAKEELYAMTKEAYAWVGTEALCEATTDNTFCITSTYTDPDGFTQSFEGGFEAKNNSPYNVAIKVMNASTITFDDAKIKLENAEENLFLGGYTLITPRNFITNGTVNGYNTEWIDAPSYAPNSSIAFSNLQVTPRKVGAGNILLRIRDNSKLIFEKTFTIGIASDKKMSVQYLYDGKFQTEIPKLVSGKEQPITVKAINQSTGLEIMGAMVKLYDRFGTKLTEKETNKVGVTTINLPAALPGERLKIKIERPEFETYEKEFSISEDIVEIKPTTLSFTLNPQTTIEDSKTVRIINSTGFELTIKEIRLSGKLKGLISESQTESYFNAYKGIKIPSNDYLETLFKVFIGRVIPQADDLEGEFEVVVGNEYNTWSKKIPVKIRVGLGQDVDDPACLEITKNNWTASTQGKEMEVSFDVINNCMADAKLVNLKNLGARNETTGNNLGTMSVQAITAYAELSRSYNRIFKVSVAPGEKIPVTLKFTPYGGVNGVASGKIIFEAENLTDSKNQKISTSLSYTMNVINLQDCIVVGADLVQIEPESSGSFSVTNNCPTTTDFSIDSELALSDKIFTLKANETKDVTITRNEGDLPGAYNILIYAREGNQKQELIENVKAILPAEGCISLSRYEFDVFDSEYNDIDGIDRAYVRNHCTKKNIGVSVEGTEPYDKDEVWQQALLGGIIGYLKSKHTGMCALTGDLFGLIDCDKNKEAGKVTEQDLKNNNKNPEIAAGALTPKIKAELDKETMDMLEGIQASSNELATIGSGNYTSQQANNNHSVTESKAAVQNVIGKFSNTEEKIVKLFFSSPTSTINQSTKIKESYKKIDEKISALLQINDKMISEIKSNYLEVKQTEFDRALERIGTSSKGQITHAQAAAALNTASAAASKARDNTYAKYKPDYDTAKKAAKEMIVIELPKVKTALTDMNTEFATVNKNLAAGCTKDNNWKPTSSCCSYDQCTGCPSEYNGVSTRKCNEDNPNEQAVKDSFADIKEELKEQEQALLEAYTQDCSDCKNITAPAQIATATPQTRGGKFVSGMKTFGSWIAAPVVWVAQGVAHTADFTTDAFTCSFEGFCNKQLSLSKTLIEPKMRDINTAIAAVVFDLEKAQNAGDKLNDTPAKAAAAEKAPGTDQDRTNPQQTKEKSLIGQKFTINDTEFTIQSKGQDGKYSATASIPNPSAKGATLQSQNIIVIVKGNTLDELKAEAEKALGTTLKEEKLTTVQHTFSTDSTKFCSHAMSSPEIVISCVVKGDKVEIVTKGTSDNPNVTNLYTYDQTDRSFRATSATGVNIVSLPANYDKRNQVQASFLLATNTAQANTSLGGTLTSVLTNNIPGIGGGALSNSGLGGALVSALLEMLMASDTAIQYSDTMEMDKVVIGDISLASPDGISVEVGDVSYDFESSGKGFSTVGETAGSSGGTRTTNSAQGGMQAQTFSTGVSYNPQALTATQGLVELRELTFTNSAKAVNKTPYQPFAAILTVGATEKVYETGYDYQEIKKAAVAREEYKEPKGIFDSIPLIGDWFKPQTTSIAEIREEDLLVKETRDYTKKFHLLFNAYEYVDCGPTTYPCPPGKIGNCTIDNGKVGSTGAGAAPRLLLAWNWGDVSVNTCDEDNTDYVYCDTTQFTLSTLKKIQEMKTFFRSTALPSCPQAIDVAGTKTQDLAENTLDVALTRTQFRPISGGATLEAIVKSNNELPMSVKVSFVIKQTDGTEVSVPACKDITKTMVSEEKFTCDATGLSGTYNVRVIAAPTLCEGCENNVTTNDSINAMLIVGSANIQDCQEYSTKTDYFEKVLAANNALSGRGATVLNYTNFTVNLVRDAFSNDFKADFDAYSMQIANAPSFYKDEGLKELFLSNKFQVEWPNRPQAWEAGKYNARIIIKFKENWSWNDNNNIESIRVVLEPWGPPEPYHSIYNIGFNGLVGVETDNGRQGYGVNFTQVSESPLYITDTITARPDPYNNGVSNATVSIDKSFYNMNSPTRKGNILTISRVGKDVSLVMSPSTAVPLLLTVRRNSARDAYAYYMAEVAGQPQNEMGATFLQWRGIGQGCFDFRGAGMGNWIGASDEKSDTIGQGYGLRWNNATHAGSVYLYSTMYAPQDLATTISITHQSESANFESSFGSGQMISVTGSGGIKSIQDVIDKVVGEEVCVIGGEYFWNSGKVYEPIAASIASKENTCIGN